MRFFRALLWEFVQNLPLVAGFIGALWFWQQSKYMLAVACVVVSSVAGALIIRITESKIVEGHREPVRVTLVNIAVMTVLMFASVAYLSAGWSSWKTDLLVGGLAGIALGVAQDLTAKKSIGIGHCIALACSGPAALIGIRVLVAALSILVNTLIITAVVTLIIALVDYGPLMSAEQDKVGS